MSRLQFIHTSYDRRLSPHPYFCLVNLFRLTCLLSLMSVVLRAQVSPPEPETFLRTRIGLTPAELGTVEKGGIIVKLPKTPETREVAAFAVMRLDIPAEFFVEKVRDIVTFKKSDNVLQIGKFSTPPQLEDLAGLTLDDVDLEAIRKCRVNSCDIKMSRQVIERFRKEVNWSAPDYRDRVAELVRGMLLEQANNYLNGGNAALADHNDKSYVVRPSDEFRSLLQPAPYMYEYVPEFQAYLQDFPASRPEGVEDFIYWSKEKFGLKPVVSMTHITIYRLPRPRGTDILIASKGIYATHYFEASLGLTAFVQSQSSPREHSYLMYINRSRADALRGLFAGLKRTLISGSLRDGARKNMELIKTKLEGEYARQ